MQTSCLNFSFFYSKTERKLEDGGWKYFYQYVTYTTCSSVQNELMYKIKENKYVKNRVWVKNKKQDSFERLRALQQTR